MPLERSKDLDNFFIAEQHEKESEWVLAIDDLPTGLDRVNVVA